MRPILALSLAFLFVGCAADPGNEADDVAEQSAALAVPPGLEVPGDQHIVLEAHGVGFQVYQCTDTPSGHAWTFRAPAALLFAPDGEIVASHFGGIDVGLPPGVYWQSTLDGSRVHGGNAVSAPNPGAVALLRLQALDTAGDGIFTPVTFIHRLATVGGLAPTGQCGRLGTRLPVFYQAEYVFYAAGLPRPEAPATLVVPAGNNLAHALHGEGFQVYSCLPDASGNLAWTFRAPRAQLFDDDHKLVANHFGGIETGLPAGVYWQSVKDGSRVHAGNAISVPNPGAVPLVRLQTLDTARTGIFSRVSFLQRLTTVGGLAPTGACAPQDAQVAVPYTADYFFYIPNLDGV
jgi:hypothetical protein